MRQLIGMTGFAVAALAVSTTLWAQVDIEPPAASAPKSSTTTVANPDAATRETPRPPSAGTPTTTGTTATTLPSAQSTLDTLLKDKPDAPARPSATPDDGSLTPSLAGSAPGQPKAVRMREGEFVFNRTGRLAKDDKTQQTIFVFDSDGQGMSDPPIALIPSRLLASMEDAAANSAQEVKFKVSGEVTEYRGKNFLYVQKMETVRALNKGIDNR